MQLPSQKEFTEPCRQIPFKHFVLVLITGGIQTTHLTTVLSPLLYGKLNHLIRRQVGVGMADTVGQMPDFFTSALRHRLFMHGCFQRSIAERESCCIRTGGKAADSKIRLYFGKPARTLEAVQTHTSGHVAQTYSGAVGDRLYVQPSDPDAAANGQDERGIGRCHGVLHPYAKAEIADGNIDAPDKNICRIHFHPGSEHRLIIDLTSLHLRVEGDTETVDIHHVGRIGRYIHKVVAIQCAAHVKQMESLLRQHRHAAVHVDIKPDAATQRASHNPAYNPREKRKIYFSFHA